MTRSRSSVVPALLLLALGLAACGTDAPGGPAPSSAVSPSVDGAFPVTVTHRFGETVVPAAPKRIVTLGGADLDALLALEITPVGYAEVSGPWARFPAGGVPPSGAKPVPISSGVPGVADIPPDVLGPDLVLDVGGYMERSEYDYFRAFAPTVGPPAGSDELDRPAWQEVTRTVGRAVGRPVEADRLVAETEQRLAAAPARYPELAGRTGVCISYDGGKGGSNGYSVDSPGGVGPDGPCAAFLARFGMRSVPALDLPTGRRQIGEAGTFLQAEQIAAARPDVVVVLDQEGVRQTVRTLLPPDVRVADLDDTELAALSPSVLSVPVALKTVPAKLVRAIG